MAEEVVTNLMAPQTDKMKQANISLITDNYEDIFSDFDPRPYLERSLSEDFLEECKRAARDKKDGLELRILIPKDKRNLKEEWKIKKRLKDHFSHHLEIENKNLRSMKRGGFFWVGLGVIINVIVVSGLLNFNSNIVHTILGVFEVPSWFLIWEGMTKILIESKEIKPAYDFYKKMAKAEINFTEY